MYEEFQCELNADKQRAKGHTEDAIRITREKKGCFGESTRVMTFDDKFKVVGCVCRYKHSSFDFYWQCYSHYKQTGQYPNGKPMLDQPNKLVDIFNSFKRWELEFQEAQQKKAK